MRKAAGQFIRFATVGLASNALGYLLYLLITVAGMEPKLAMTLLYAVGVAQTFVFNKRWSFRHGGMHGPAFVRYCAAYGLGYLVNLTMLYLFVNRYGFSHQLIQGIAVFVVAGLLFILLRYWVFARSPTHVS